MRMPLALCTYAYVDDHSSWQLLPFKLEVILLSGMLSVMTLPPDCSYTQSPFPRETLLTTRAALQ